MEKQLTAGVSIIDISPAKGLELAGYPHCPRYNTGIHDPLYASCIYLDDGKIKLVMIAVDLLFYFVGILKIQRIFSIF
jgi:neutral ceramidase